MSTEGAAGKDYGKKESPDERFEVRNAWCDFRRKKIFPRGRWKRGSIRQIGKYGALIEIKEPLEYGDRLELMLRLVAYNEPIRAVGQAVRIKEKGNGNGCSIGSPPLANHEIKGQPYPARYYARGRQFFPLQPSPGIFYLLPCPVPENYPQYLPDKIEQEKSCHQSISAKRQPVRWSLTPGPEAR